MLDDGFVWMSEPAARPRARVPATSTASPEVDLLRARLRELEARLEAIEAERAREAARRARRLEIAAELVGRAMSLIPAPVSRLLRSAAARALVLVRR
jgi:hypothetical protein